MYAQINRSLVEAENYSRYLLISDYVATSLGIIGSQRGVGGSEGVT